MARLKLKKTIVDTKRNLIGFIVSGKEKDLGGFSNAEVERGYTTADLIKTNFSNNQISVVNGKFVERNNFKINSLPMCIYTGSSKIENAYVDTSNIVNITTRYVQNNENVGFRLRFADGSEDNFRYENVIMICKWFRPGNFEIRTSSKGNQFICGKKGSSLLDIPAVVIGEQPKQTPKKMKSAAKAPKEKFSGALETGFDILDIYDFIKSCGGSIIKLPSEKYAAATKYGETVTDGFTSLGIGEIASPNPLFNASKINVNAGFKKVGVVPVTINGSTNTLTSYVFRQKSIFLNGENYIKKFGIAVPSEMESKLLGTLGSSLALDKITDPSVIQPLSQVIDSKSLAFYRVNTEKVDLISEKKRESSILSAKELKNVCLEMFELKLLSKALGPKGGYLKDLKEFKVDYLKSIDKKPMGMFSMFSEEGLRAVTEAGIDIYTGAYTIAGKAVSKSKSDSSSSVETVIDETVEIEYSVNGYDTGKLTGKQIIKLALAEDRSKVTSKVIDIIKGLEAMPDSVEKYAKVIEINNSVEARIAALNKTLWLHNASMYINGNKKNIHSHDAKKWVPETNTKVKKYNVYAYNGKDGAGLIVKFTGVTI